MNIRIDDLQLISFQNGYANVFLVVTASEGAWNFTEEFHIGRQVVGSQIVTDARGWPKRADGVFVDPETLDPGQPEPVWARETVTQDLRAEIRDVVTKTMKGKLARGAKQDPPDFMKAEVKFGSRLDLPVGVRAMLGQVVQ